jgi:hypothetical protein
MEAALHSDMETSSQSQSRRVKEGRHTLSSLVKPLIIHSSVSAGDSTDVEFAASTKDSVIMLTVNSLVEMILFLVSFGLRVDKLNDTLTIGGLCAT